MTKKILLIITIVILVGVLWWFGRGYFSRQQNNLQNNQNSPDQQIPDNNQNSNDQDSFFSFIDGLSDTEKASIRNSEEFSDLLKTQVICNRLVDQEKSDCLTDLHIAQIVIANRVDMCSKLSDADQCYYLLSIKTLNSQSCSLIQKEQLKKECLYFIADTQASSQDNIQICLSINDDRLKYNCIDNNIYRHDDLEYCSASNITTNGLQDRCRSLILFNQAVKAKDSTLCQQIPLDEYLQSCLSEI